jgi:hypothetical protein
MTTIPFGLGLYLPEEVQEQVAVRKEADRHWEQAEAFVRELKAIDERLDLIWVKQGATDFPVPGRWYIVRHGEHARASAFWVIQNEKGGYSPPTQQHLDRLRAMDSHAHPDVYRRMERTRREEERARAKQKADRSEEFRGRLEERLTFNNRVQIPVSATDKDKL